VRQSIKTSQMSQGKQSLKKQVVKRKQFLGWRCDSEVEQLPSIYEILSLIPSRKEKREKKIKMKL
jgi:hypothetical protein